MKARHFGTPKRTTADKANALTMALHNIDEARLLAMSPADLSWTGAAPRDIECRLLARQDVIRRRLGG